MKQDLDNEIAKNDSISLYLHEIEEVDILTEEQEIELFKTIEDGNNIIQNVIKNSGILIPAFYSIAHKAFSKLNINEPGKTHKEIDEEMKEKRRLIKNYGEYIKPVLAEMQQYMCLKKSLFETEQSITIDTNEELIELRASILPELQKVNFQTKEIDDFLQKYNLVKIKIEEYYQKLEKKMKELRISNSSDYLKFSDIINSEDKVTNLEHELNMSAEEICEIYSHIQKITCNLQRLEYEFENTIDDILEEAEQLEYGREMIERAKNNLIKANLRLVASISKKYTNNDINFFDLITEGNIALIKAIENFKYRKGITFSTYAKDLIRKAITNYIYCNNICTIRIPVQLIEQINTVVHTGHQLIQNLGREPTDEEIAQELGWPIEKVTQIKNIARGQIPLDNPIVEDEELANKRDFTLFQEQLRTVINYLPPREQEVLKMRFGLEEGYPLSVEEIALYFDSTPERIRQIESRALKRIRFKDK